MSKKQLLNESEIRRFMKLANLEPLTKNVLRENSPALEQASGKTEALNNRNVVVQSEAESAMGAGEHGADDAMDAMSGPETAGEPADHEETASEAHGGMGQLDLSKDQAKALIQMILDAAGLEGNVSDAGGEEDMGDAEMDLDMGSPEGGEKPTAAPEDEMEGDEQELEEVQEVEEGEELDEKKKKVAPKSAAQSAAETAAKKKTAASKKKMEETLSEDSLVEAVLARVTARLMQEARKQKESTKSKMKQKVQEKLMQEASDSKNGGPLLSKGGNKYDTYKGHPDMEMGKGENGGKGGHKLEKMNAKSEHTVTHGGKNLATLGGNKS